MPRSNAILVHNGEWVEKIVAKGNKSNGKRKMMRSGWRKEKKKTFFNMTKLNFFSNHAEHRIERGIKTFQKI